MQIKKKKASEKKTEIEVNVLVFQSVRPQQRTKLATLPVLTSNVNYLLEIING